MGLDYLEPEPLGLNGFSTTTILLIGFVEVLELLTPAFGESRAFVGAHKSPIAVCFDSLHEEVRHPECIEKISSTLFLLAMILSELKEVIDVNVPRLKIHREGSLSLTAALVNEAGSVIEDLEHGYEAVGISVGSTNVAVDATYVGNCKAHTAGSFGYLSNLFQRLKNSIN